MHPKSSLKRLYIAIGILSCLGLIVTDSPALFNAFIETSSFWAMFTKNTFLGMLILSILFFYKIELDSIDSNSFNDMFWKLSVTGFFILVLLASNGLILLYLPKLWPKLIIGIDSIIGQSIFVGAFIYFVSCFYVLKRLILYQKSKEILVLWNLFEFLVFISPVFNFFNFHNQDLFFQLIALPYLLLSIILCSNFKWIAFLNYKQKLKNVVYLLIIFVLSLTMLWNIGQIESHSSLVNGLINNVLFITFCVMVNLYTFLSVLVLLFNLPTSSVFEKKFNEVMNFQKLTKSVQTGKTEEEVYHLLIESSTSTLMAVGAVLEIFEENGKVKTTIFHNTDIEKYQDMQGFIKVNNLQFEKEYFLSENLSSLKQFEEIGYTGYQSMLVLPVNSQTEKFGVLYLFSEIRQGFERELIEIVSTYVSQASNSISNLRLIQQAVSQTRYMRDREIAKRVQTGLLPSQMLDNQFLKMAAISISADEVGGDYYDFTALTDTKFVVVIGDVSGKGTSAAFHMAKLKGVFHSLATLDLPADTLLKHANAALSACLDKATFITLSILIFDFEKKLLTTCRAGHCPTLIFSASKNKAEFIEQAGVGLGIIRNHPYSVDFDVIETKLNKDDLIFLYTDGIAEATNGSGEEFGYDRIALFLNSNSKYEIEDIKSNFIRSLQMYCENKVITDDYSVLLIKIK